MKHYVILLTLTFSLLTLIGCSEKKKSSSSTTSPLCDGTNYYTSPSCPGYGGATAGTSAGYTTSGAAGGASGGTTGLNCAQNPYSYACYCQTNPMAQGCPSQPPKVDFGWGEKYPGRSLALTSRPACSTSNLSGRYPTRKATATINFKSWYNPNDPIASQYTNTTSVLKSVTGAKTFLLTDSVLRVRLTPKTEPESAGTTPEQSCYGRTTGQSYLPGYTKLKFRVKVVGTKSDNTTEEEYLGQYTAEIGSCGTIIDLSSHAGYFTGGMYLVVYDVRSNKGSPGPDNYWVDGFIDSNNFETDSAQRSSECWSMDFEVEADGTQTLN